MKKRYLIFSLVLIILIAIIISSLFVRKQYVMINSEEIKVEVAETSEEREQGLMYREELCDGCGMLFVFEEEEFHSFWMKNTLLSLDIIFINSELEIVDMLHAEPCGNETCEFYIPKEKALYVLETNLGRFDQEVIGERVSLNY